MYIGDHMSSQYYLVDVIRPHSLLAHTPPFTHRWSTALPSLTVSPHISLHSPLVHSTSFGFTMCILEPSI
jgi:hypothetical protein